MSPAPAPGPSVAKRQRSHADLLQLLDEQLGFLRDSCAAFDAGKQGEAKRLAVAIRVLVHDTAKSISLLQQLDRKGVPFWDLSFPDIPGNLLPHAGLVAIRVGPDEARYVAQLDDAASARKVPFDEWWDAPVFRDTDGTRLSRKTLILTAANKDGGAHVDPALDEAYARFANDEHGGFNDGRQQPLRGVVRVAIRQVAHEVLRTLDPSHSLRERQVPLPPEMTIGAVSITPVERATGGRTGRSRVGRNDPCPCGSGKKFKKCHGGPSFP